MTQSRAAKLLHLSVRQVQRLLSRYQTEGAAGLSSRKRGKPANNRIPDEKPVAYYSDKHAVFRVSQAETRQTGVTQFGRVLHSMAIELICANSSQAKGRAARKCLNDALRQGFRNS